jgi:hypothetical protein
MQDPRDQDGSVVAVVDDVALDSERPNASSELRSQASESGRSPRRSNRSKIASLSLSAVAGLASSAT